MRTLHIRLPTHTITPYCVRTGPCSCHSSTDYNPRSHRSSPLSIIFCALLIAPSTSFLNASTLFSSSLRASCSLLIAFSCVGFIFTAASSRSIAFSTWGRRGQKRGQRAGGSQFQDGKRSEVEEAPTVVREVREEESIVIGAIVAGGVSNGGRERQTRWTRKRW